MRPTGFEPVTFGFVDPAGDPAGLRGARFQADYSESGSAEIGWAPCGTVPHFMPQFDGRLTQAAAGSASVTGAACSPSSCAFTRRSSRSRATGRARAIASDRN